MWEQVTPADIQRVRHKLALERTAILSKYAAEIKVLDTQRDELEKFEQLVAAFAQKYLDTETSLSQTTPSEEQPTEALEEQPTEALAIEEQPAPVVAVTTDNDVSKPAAPEARQDVPSPALEITRQVSPNFGIPLRRFVGR
jgi:hypothetical protein